MSSNKKSSSSESTQQTESRPKFNVLLLKDEKVYKETRKLVEHLANENDSTFDEFWALVTEKPDKFYEKKFKKLKKANDPYADITKTSSAYSYFTKEWHTKVKEELPEDSGFGDISRELGQRWKSLSDSDKSKYEKLAAKDKVRFSKQVAQRDEELKRNPLPTVEEHTEDEEEVKPKRSRRSKKVVVEETTDSSPEHTDGGEHTDAGEQSEAPEEPEDQPVKQKKSKGGKSKGGNKAKGKAKSK